jgi:large-conductance mechanosensitive channel
MGKIITYIIYFLIAVAIFVLIKAAYTGNINSNTTIGEAATEIKDGSVQTIKEIGNDASSAIDNMRNNSQSTN